MEECAIRVREVPGSTPGSPTDMEFAEMASSAGAGTLEKEFIKTKFVIII